MGKALSLSLCLSFLFLLHGCCSAQMMQQQFWQSMQSQQQHRFRAKTQCQIQQLSAREPTLKFQSEAGFSEYWDTSSAEFECAGIEFVRHQVQPKGLVLPFYTNAPRLTFIVQGSGILGTVIPGCAETYESEAGASSRYSAREGEDVRRGDRHQKLRRFRRGDVIALPEGITTFVYNDGDAPLTYVSMLDIGNDNNQLDFKFRKFVLAGNPQSIESQKQGKEYRNMLYGFDEQLLADAFNTEPELMRRLQGKEDERGIIVRAEKLRMVLPEYESEEEHSQRRGRPYNGLEETFCSYKIKKNLDHPTSADLYNPRGGRISNVNSQSLPILNYLQLSAQRGILYKNAIVAPQWCTNAHSALYVTKGSARIQVVGTQGRSVFDGEVKEGQLLVVPQNFVVVKKASQNGFEWITFKTNDNAMNAQLAGRLSAIRAMPNEVLMNAFGISRDEAKSLKFGREESTLFSPSQRYA
ncbi:11S globulin seed storage protein Ana o 2.0101-like [Salvia hispanica]|uniref:11S globulin seed storage protein Ana o 2.0101-like n=1 Tax=Salvia hispanica TaxID=49212 RepID=UPI0020098708|nr:11S globulin seed storage protein Ana o 2.0101-like [Salvia hispanica]